MKKRQIGTKNYLYPMPVTLVGANQQGRPNYLAVAWCSIVNQNPPFISVALNKSHHTNTGIRQNGSFSVNIPSADMLKITDYCGLVSGHNVDKSELFDTFYGKLGTAPMITACPINIECKLIRTVELVDHEAFIGQIVAVYSEEEFLTDDRPDIKKINPLVFSMHDNCYWSLGKELARAWEVGRGYDQNKK